MANYNNNLGQTRLGWRTPVVTNSPVQQTNTISASLLQSLYGVWNGDTTTNELVTSLYGVWNAEYSGTTSLETSLYGVWNGESLGTSLDTSIYRVYNGDNLNDTSGNSQNGTNVGGVTFTTGKVGNAFTFNGSNYVSLPNNSLNFTGDFSYSLWVNLTNLTGLIPLINNFDHVVSDYRGNMIFLSGTTLYFRINYSNANPVDLTWTYPGTNQWVHVVVTRKASTRSRMYINGTLVISNTSTINPTYYPTMPYNTIGAYYDSNGYRYLKNGDKVDAVMAWDKELTETEIASLYNGGVGVEYPFSSKTLPSSNDSFGTNHGTLMNGTNFTTGKIGNAFSFDGVNDIVRLPNNSLDLTGDFSISMWANWGRNNTSQILMSNLTIGTLDHMDSIKGWFIEHAAGQLRFRGLNSSGGNAFYIYTAYTPPLNTWVHYTFVHKNSSNKMYADGVLIGSDTGGSTHVAYDTPNYPMIGANQYNSTTYQEFFLGKLDAVSVWNRELTSNEVSMLYNGSNGTQYSSGSFGLTQSSLDSFGTYHGTLSSTSFTTGKFGSAFNFTGGNINMGTGAANFGTNPFTISLWFYPNAGNNLQVLVAKGFTGGTDKGFYLNTDNRYNSNLNGISFGLNTGGTYRTIVTTSAFPYTAAAWNHLVVTRSGNTTLIYLNGVLTSTANAQVAGTGDVSGDISNTGANMLLAQYGSGGLNFSGRMDALTMWNKAISVDEVTQLYNSGTGAQYPFTGTFSSAINQLGVDNGTLMNGCYLSNGKIGKAFTFDGINDFVLLPTNSMRFTGDFSYSFFVSLGSTSGQQTVFSCENYLSNENGDRGYLIYFTNGVLKFGGYYNSSVIVSSLSTTTVTANTWNHFVVTKTSSQVKIYMNGVLQTTTNYTGIIAYNSVVYPSIGVTYKQNNVNNNNYHYISAGSKIDALTAYQKELTQSEITELYNSGNGKQITATPIVQSGLVLNLDASRSSSYTGTGTTWTDISGNSNNGTMVNGPVFGTASGGIITFDGVNDYVDTGLQYSLTSSTNFTIGIWFKGFGRSSSNDILVLSYSGTPVGWAIYQSNTGKFMCFSRDNNNVETSYINSTTSTNTNQWFYGVYKKSGNQFSLYINGILEATTNANLGNISISNGMRIANHTVISQPYLGSIGSVKVYNKSLTDSEILQNFNATKSRFGL